MPKPQTKSDMKMSVMQAVQTALGTLAALTVNVVAGPTMTRGGRLLSVRGSIAAYNLTAGDGPFLVGIARKDITSTLLTEYLEIGGPVTPSDTVAVEKSSRGGRIRTLGVLSPQGDGVQGALPLSDNSLSCLLFSEEDA